MQKNNEKNTVSFIVPTGIGAKIGGFAGDASSYARKFAKHFNVIVNPNVVNAALFSGITNNMIYCEGYFLGEFFANNINLKKINNHKIGVIFDRSINKNILNIHINTINAIKTVYDYDILPYVITDEEVGVRFYKDESGGSFGDILNSKTLIEAGLKLKSFGATEICVICNFNDDELDDDSDYIQGQGVDIVGGVEAIISHFMSKELQIMTVHAPAFSNVEIEKRIINPKSAAEYVTLTYLPCLFFGLQYAYKPVLTKDKNSINVKDVKALILPYDALGSKLVLNALNNNVKVIAVKENTSCINATAKNLGLENDIIEIPTYKECLDYLLFGYNCC